MVSNKLVVALAVLGVGFAIAQMPSCCYYTDRFWGYYNPNSYYFCNPATQTSVEQACPSGRGFIDNGTILGCVPFSDWSCIPKVQSAPNCTGNNVNQPSPASNPNQFYFCPGEGKAAVLTNCESGKGFVASNCGDLGCVDWMSWRSITNCYF